MRAASLLAVCSARAASCRSCSCRAASRCASAISSAWRSCSAPCFSSLTCSSARACLSWSICFCFCAASPALGAGISLSWAGAFRATEVAVALTCDASGATGKLTLDSVRAVRTGSGGGAGAVAGVGAGVRGVIDTEVTSLGPTAGDDTVIAVTSLATAGLSTAASPTLAVFVGKISAGAGADADAMGCAGASKMRKSLASWRLSFQGKLRPGSPNAWPPKVTLNSSV